MMMLVSYKPRSTYMFFLCFILFFLGVHSDCGPPPSIQNTKEVQETSGTPGQNVVYTCDRDAGYYEIPDRSRTITCQDDGTWTNLAEFCTRACGVPERLEFAVPVGGALDLDIFYPGQNVSYECRRGYVRVPGFKTLITCLNNYTWSTDIFCKLKSCGNPGEPDNGYMEANEFTFGSRVNYFCNEGYSMKNSRNYRDCQANGKWSNVVPQCETVVCAAPEKPVDGTYYPEKDEYNYMDAVTFSCQKSLELVGTSSIACTEEGKWSDSIPTCKGVLCINPDVKHSIRRAGFVGPYRLNSAILFDCKPGYVLRGSSSVTCNINSQWEPDVPECLTISCGHPGTIANGDVSYVDTGFGSIASYTCKEGFAPTSSVSSKECQENGTWSNLNLLCKAVCNAPPRLNFALPDETFDKTYRYFSGTSVKYKCIDGYKLNSFKNNIITCIGHKWSEPDDFCTRISCGHPGNISNGDLSFPDYLYGSKVTYTCKKGYVTNTTRNYRECQANGTWTMAIECTGIPEHRPNMGMIIGIILGVLFFVGAIIVIYKYLKRQKKRG